MMAITSQLRSTASFGEVWIVDWQKSNLLKPSAIKPVFATIEQPLVIRHLGVLQSTDLTTLRAAIHGLLG